MYIWLMKQKESQFPSTTIASKVMSSQQITKIVSFYDSTFKGASNISADKQEEVLVDPNNLFVSNFDTAQRLYFKDMPFHHEIGD